MTEQHGSNAQTAQFEEVAATAVPSGDALSLEDLYSVKLELTAELGRARMLVREVLELRKGSVITLNKAAGDMTELFINGLPLGRGEVVVINDELHVRVAEIAGAELKVDAGDGGDEK